MAEALSEQPEPRNLETVSGELQRRLDDASAVLERFKIQQAACSSLLFQFERDLNVVLALSREVKGLLEEKAQQPPGVVATLQAAVEKTRETVAGQVGQVRDRAAAALHRIKGDNPPENGERSLNDRR